MAQAKIKINLYPYTKEPDKKIVKFLSQYFPIAFLGTIIGVMINVIIYFSIGFTYVPYRQLTRQWEQLTPQVKALAALRDEVNALKDEKARFEELIAAKLVLSRIFSDLYAALPQDIWLERIALSNNVLSISGYVVKWQQDYMGSLKKFITDLQSQAYFNTNFGRVDLKTSRKTEYNGRESMRFDLECKSLK